MKILQPSTTLLWITRTPEIQIELAGRTCYKSEDKITSNSAFDFCEKMRKSNHHSMLEHACASFRIITDRGISHEIVRHRLASYAQESTRYCNYLQKGENCYFIQPPNLTDSQLHEWISACEDAEKSYFNLLRLGTHAEIARSVLPTSLKTELIMTANFREFRHFISLRGTQKAHPQIRPIALAIWTQLMEYSPSIFIDLKPEGYDKMKFDLVNL